MRTTEYSRCPWPERGVRRRGHDLCVCGNVEVFIHSWVRELIQERCPPHLRPFSGVGASGADLVTVRHADFLMRVFQ